MFGELSTSTEEVACVGSPVSTEEVDELGYLTVNPDVRASGMSARDHFEKIGKNQGRLQAINLNRIERLRERKLATVAFSSEPRVMRQLGQAADFLSEALIEEFAVPDAPPISAHPYPPMVAQLIRDNPSKLFLDVGAGLRPTYYANVVNTEIYQSSSTDVLCVGEALPFDNDQFDFVFCFATLEHTKRPWDVAAEICRVLKPGGTVMIDYPFMQPVHGYPHHYFNATPMGNRSLFEEECVIQAVEIGWHHHPMIGLQWILTVFHNGLQTDDAQVFGNVRVKDIVGQSLDNLLGQPYCTNLHPEMQRVIASGSLLTATKRGGQRDPVQTMDPVRPKVRTETIPSDVSWRVQAAADAKIADLTRRNYELQRQQEALLNSTSWRITSALRACGRVLYGRPR
jgi:SAM-dependent methyltransferase